jgi:hypothetical protein
MIDILLKNLKKIENKKITTFNLNNYSMIQLKKKSKQKLRSKEWLSNYQVFKSRFDLKCAKISLYPICDPKELLLVSTFLNEILSLLPSAVAELL